MKGRDQSYTYRSKQENAYCFLKNVLNERREYMRKKIGRNDLCPCGSGKKYKLCCIHKMSEEEIQALYLEQFELTKGLNDVNKCHKVLDIGKRIIEHQQKVNVPLEHM